ncbi:hypothetical protein BASA81_011341 [Batrachochytrium salamandrivorans]|nr:hypothetical protein BASA81_011341 [Batrachochytrium salamandrivorans]
MDEFKSRYAAKCGELATQPLATVLDALARSQSRADAALDLLNPDTRCDTIDTSKMSVRRCLPSMTESLNLSGQSIPFKAASALAAALATDCFFTRIVLADAFLGDDGCIIIAGALKTNTTVTHLDLRGNSIRADGAIALGQMIKVNSALKSLSLEWNCVGIWEAGIHSIADSLALNQTLEELDLRNNKIGPQASQHLAFALKHNTRLRTLDLRWNNAGLIGGRAFLDLLKWNTVLMDLNLTGNDIPEDLHRGISSALERNSDRYKHDIHTKAHKESLTNTLQSLTLSHQDAMARLTSKLATTDQNALTLSQKLSLASSEISETQNAYRSLEVKLERITKDKCDVEDTLISERNQFQAKMSDMQRELVSERERRMRAEDKYQGISTETTTRILELESSLKRAELDVEVLRRDKAMLLDDVSVGKEKERAISQLWEEKLQRSDGNNHSKLMKFQNLKDEELAERCKKYDERIRVFEIEKAKAQEEIDAVRNKLITEKRYWAELVSETETRIHKEEEVRRKDMESQLQTMQRQRNALQEEVASHQSAMSAANKENGLALKRLQDQRTQLNQELSDLQASESHHIADLTQLRNRLEASRQETKDAQILLSQFQAETVRNREANERAKKEVADKEKATRHEDHEKALQQIAARDAVIARLKEELRRREDEIQNKDDENMIRMKELQLNINTLLTQRTRKHTRTKSTDFEVSLAT